MTGPKTTQDDQAIQYRTIVVGVIQNENGEILVCKKPADRGVFPGQWGLPGGGIEPGEKMEAALRREIHEEVGIQVIDVRPLFFTDGQYPKTYPDGSQREVYMIFLVFSCLAASEPVRLGQEFIEYAWVNRSGLNTYDLNITTRDTFQRIGMIDKPLPRRRRM
jgi:nucleoside triphosphatase